MKYRACVCCGQPFTAENVFTLDGIKETRISGTCEKCFDEMFDEDGREDEDWFFHPNDD